MYRAVSICEGKQLNSHVALLRVPDVTDKHSASIKCSHLERFQLELSRRDVRLRLFTDASQIVPHEEIVPVAHIHIRWIPLSNRDIEIDGFQQLRRKCQPINALCWLMEHDVVEQHVS